MCVHIHALTKPTTGYCYCDGQKLAHHAVRTDTMISDEWLLRRSSYVCVVQECVVVEVAGWLEMAPVSVCN